MKVIVYGIGEFYKVNKQILIPESYEVIAFIAEDDKVKETLFENKPIIKLEDILNWNFEKVIIANSKWIEVEQKVLTYGVVLEDIIIPMFNQKEYKNTLIESKIDKLIKNNDKPKLSIICDSNSNFISRFEEYFSRKYYVTFFILNLQESRIYINKILKYSDICFFEWVASPLVLASYSDLAKNKPIIARLHRYEVYTPTITRINWENIDQIIFIAKHIKDKFNKKVNLEKNKLKIIYNGFEIDKFTYKERSKGFNMAYVGIISYRKNIQLILFLIQELKKIDNNYKLHIAGEFENGEYKDYIYYMIKCLKIEDNIVFSGRVMDINKWLENKNYIICSSASEGHITSIQEAMLKGIKPIIYNYEGAEEIYPNKFLWNTLNQALDMILNSEYNSIEYRNLIEEKFNIEVKAQEIMELIEINYRKYIN